MLFQLFVLQAVPAKAQDSVEFLNGTELSGKILQIRKQAKEFDFEYEIAGKPVKQTIGYSKVHAVRFGGKEFVLTPKGTTDPSATPSDSGNPPTRTVEQVQALIDSVGASDPDWLDDVPLNHPKTLDLSWPIKVDGPWNESKNVGQYIWGRVNPNVSRWKSGIKLIYQCMELHEGNRELLQRDMEKLGVMYFQLLQDYERAAYWLQKANADPSKESGVHLAECYWRLGSKPMAMRQLRGRQPLHFSAIKLFGDMGEVKKALDVTRIYERSNLFNEAWINAGDALRAAGLLDEAVSYYQKVLDRNQARNAEYLARFKGRASEAIEAIRLFDKADVSRVADGTYEASATGYNGPLEVEVTVDGSRISEVKVVDHQEKQFYAALTDTPTQIIDRQGFQDIDGTSGATITSQAIVNATAKAMAKGAR
jgi:uncharacterized protein with FMN-binding domain